MGKIAVRDQDGFCFRAAYGEYDVFADANGVAGKPESLSFLHHETSGRSDPFGKNLLSIAIEGWREIQKFTPTQGAQAGVEVIEPIVD